MGDAGKVFLFISMAFAGFMVVILVLALCVACIDWIRRIDSNTSHNTGYTAPAPASTVDTTLPQHSRTSHFVADRNESQYLMSNPMRSYQMPAPQHRTIRIDAPMRTDTTPSAPELRTSVPELSEIQVVVNSDLPPSYNDAVHDARGRNWK